MTCIKVGDNVFVNADDTDRVSWPASGVLLASRKPENWVSMFERSAVVAHGCWLVGRRAGFESGYICVGDNELYLSPWVYCQ